MMKRFVFSALRTVLPLAAVFLGACSKDDIPIDRPDGPVELPTAYQLDLPARFKQPLDKAPAHPADNPLTVEGVELGRHLFYETALSSDGTVSCGTCHRQELAFTDGLAHAKGVAGAQHARSAMSLANLMWVSRLNWDGAAGTLEEQARIPLENHIEMNQPLTISVGRLQALPKYPAMFRRAFGSSTVTSENMLKALAQFERTLISSNSRYDRYKNGDLTALTSDEVKGMKLFMTHPYEGGSSERGGNCKDCHGGELMSDNMFRNNGLDSAFTDLGRGGFTGQATDNGKFRVPSLRNIGLTAPYMHDGRFATLEDVLTHYNEHVMRNNPTIDPLMNATNDPNNRRLTLDLTRNEKALIIKFLHTLTDTEFVQNPKFAKPQE